MSENKNDNQPPAPRANRAIFVWILILLAMTGLFFAKNYVDGKPQELTQSTFEQYLQQGRILSARLKSEGGNSNTVEIFGRMLLVAPEANADSDNIEIVSNSKAPSELKYHTIVIYSDSIAKALSSVEMQVDSSKEGIVSILLQMIPWVAVMLILFFFISRQLRRAGNNAAEFGRSRHRVIQPGDLKIKFDDVAGADEAKEEVQEIVEYLRDPLRFQLVGGQIPRGCLLVGEPGTGKTMLAKAVACESGVPFFSISGSDFVEMFVGVGASRVRDMFEQARKSTPCLIFIDEIDAVGRSRFSGMGGGHDEREQTLNAILVEMDGLESRNGVIVLAATNRPDVLDPALLRPGRFDRQIMMDLPDIAGRRKILEVHIKKIKIDNTVNLDVVARTTPGFSGADLANLCNEAALLAARYHREAATQLDMEEARDKVAYGRERKSKRVSDRERKLTAYHEAGHTLVAMSCEHATPVHKVTIIPRGQSLGSTMTMPKEDVYTRSKLEILDEMAVFMGGRVAEELVFGDITSGASADIMQATRFARLMTCIYGMTDLGPVKYDDYVIHPHVRYDSAPPENHAPETLREIDVTIRSLINGALNRARDILKKRRNDLDKLAEALLVKETLDVSEVEQLLRQEEQATPDL